MPFSVTGLFSGISVHVLVDEGRENSLVSLDFALSNNIPRTVVRRFPVTETTASGPMLLPSPNGWYRSTCNMPVASLALFDVVLGLDWLRLAAVDESTGFLPDPDISRLEGLGSSVVWSAHQNCREQNVVAGAQAPPPLMFGCRRGRSK